MSPNILPKNVPNTIKSQEKFGRILMLTWEHRKVRRLNQTTIREDSGRLINILLSKKQHKRIGHQEGSM